MLRGTLFIGLAVLTAGCSGFDLKRLAPPGIVRYERIADEKEPNPEIEDRIAEYQQDRKARFPKLGETAAGSAEMTGIPNSGVDDAVADLEAARENLELSIDESLSQRQADEERRREIDQFAAALSQSIDEAKAAAEREERLRRREQESSEE